MTKTTRKLTRTDIGDELHLLRRAVEGATRLSQSAEQELDETAREIHREVSAVLMLIRNSLFEIGRDVRNEVEPVPPMRTKK